MKSLSELLQQDFVSFDEVEEHRDDHTTLATEKKQAPAGYLEQDFISFDELDAELAKTLCDNTPVKLSAGQKSVQNPAPRTLIIQTHRGIYGEVIIPPYSEALEYASRASLAIPLPEFQDTCVFWTDGSAGYHGTMRASGAAVVYKRRQGNSSWMREAFSIIPYCESYLAELIAIRQALDIALNMNRKRSPYPCRRVIIFSDCRGALRDIAQLPFVGDAARGEIMRTFVKTSLALYRLGIRLELRLVPGDYRVPGNIGADGIAKKARNRASRRNFRPPHREIARFGRFTVYPMGA